MDFKEQLIEAYDKGDWNLLVDLALEIRKANSKESFFGLRKNYFNIIQCSYGHSTYRVGKELLSKMGFQVIGSSTSQFLKKVKEGKINIEDAAKNIAIITKSSDMPGELSRIKFPYTYFELRLSNNGEEIREARRSNLEPPKRREWFYLQNIETGEEYEFDECHINGLLRDEKIDSILEDI
jgi:hypothetical protein